MGYLGWDLPHPEEPRAPLQINLTPRNNFQVQFLPRVNFSWTSEILIRLYFRHSCQILKIWRKILLPAGDNALGRVRFCFKLVISSSKNLLVFIPPFLLLFRSSSVSVQHFPHSPAPGRAGMLHSSLFPGYFGSRGCTSPEEYFQHLLNRALKKD